MKCPACKKRLKVISPAQKGDFICDNEECPANQKLHAGYDPTSVYYEFYGTQEEINTQWP